MHKITATKAARNRRAPHINKLPPRIRLIVIEEAELAEISPARILGPAADPSTVRARWRAMTRVRGLEKLSGGKFSYPEIGRFFGKDHTSVMYGVRKLAERG